MSDFDFTHLAYANQLAGKKLVGSRCVSCGQVNLPPRLLCSTCRSSDLEPFEFSGKGKLAAFTVIYRPLSFMKEDGYGPKNPYVSGIVELNEGPCISALILGLDAAHPESIQIGLPLTLTFIEREEKESRKTFLAFRT